MQSRRSTALQAAESKKATQPPKNGRDALQKQEQSGAGAAPAASTPATPKPRKLSYKEQRELDELPARIAALEAEQQSIADALADGSLFASDNARAVALTERSAAIDDALMAALERWESLDNPQ